MLVEEYSNTLYQESVRQGQLCKRYWVLKDKLMVGGSILDQADWDHLKSTYGMTAVVNVETEHSDVEKGIPLLLEAQVPDDGTPKPVNLIKTVYEFSKSVFDDPNGRLYLHCQGGGSRSPAFAYGVLRSVFKMSKEESLKQVRDARASFGKDGWGDHHYHQNYMASMDEAL